MLHLAELDALGLTPAAEPPSAHAARCTYPLIVSEELEGDCVFVWCERHDVYWVAGNFALLTAPVRDEHIIQIAEAVWLGNFSRPPRFTRLSSIIRWKAWPISKGGDGRYARLAHILARSGIPVFFVDDEIGCIVDYDRARELYETAYRGG